MKRKQMLLNCPEEFKSEMIAIIDEIESRVNDAIRNIEAVDSVDSLNRIEDAHNVLIRLSEDLY